VSGERRGLGRREAIRRLVGAGLVTATTAELAEGFFNTHPSGGGPPGDSSYRPRFFADAEFQTVARLASLTIPSDETPGAREARVEEWIDFLLSESDEARRRLYRDGLARLGTLCQERHAESFLKLPEAAQVQVLQQLSEAQAAFFQALKEDVVFGFYTSEIGLSELQWGGQTFHAECPGCNHPAHLNWQPDVPADRTPS
jgi:hypothetical protein